VGVLGFVTVLVAWRRRQRKYREAMIRNRREEAVLDAIWSRRLRAAPQHLFGRWMPSVSEQVGRDDSP
jgi:hypothetical protein